MINDNKIAFAANVLLIDVNFLHQVVAEIVRRSREEGCEMPSVAWEEWVSYLAMDAGLKPGKNEVQVLLLHEAGVEEVSCCSPSKLSDIDGKACVTPLGELQFACVPTAGMTTISELFADLLRLALDSKEVQQLMLLPQGPRCYEEVETRLTDLFHEHPLWARRVTYFVLDPSTVALPCKVDTAFCALAKALRL